MSNQSQGADAAWLGQRQAWYSLFVLLLIYSLSFADRMIMTLLIEPIKHSLHVSDTQVSLLVGLAFAGFYVLMGLPSGYISDRVNRRNFIIIGLLSWSVMTGLCGLSNSFALLFFARMGVGVGEATLTPSAYSLLADTFPPEKLGRAASIYAMGVPLGSGGALMAGGALVSALAVSPTVTVPFLGVIDSWRTVFLILASVGLPLALLLTTVREPARRGVVTTRPKATLGDTLRFLKRRRALLMRYLPGAGLHSIALNGAMVWAATFFVRTYHTPIQVAGFYFGAIVAFCGLAGLLLGGFVGDYFYKRGRPDAHLRMVIFSSLSALPFMVMFPLAPTLPIALLLLAPAMTSMTIPAGIALVVVQMATPSMFRGQMTALYLLVATFCGLGLGPTIIALCNDYVFHSAASLRYSMAVSFAVELPCAGLLMISALKHYRAAMVALAAEIEAQSVADQNSALQPAT